MYSFAIASAIFVETIVLTNAPFLWIRPRSFLCERRYSAISIPDMLPVNDLYSPLLTSLEYTPSLSASGSVARIISASTSFASFNAYVNALGSSGLGYSSVVKFGSGFSCSGTTYTFLNPSSLKILLTGTLPVPLNGVYTILISSATCLIISPLRLIFLSAAM